MARLLKRLAQDHWIEACQKFLCLGGESGLSSGLWCSRMRLIGLEMVNADHEGNWMRGSAGEIADRRFESKETDAAL